MLSGQQQQSSSSSRSTPDLDSTSSLSSSHSSASSSAFPGPSSVPNSGKPFSSLAWASSNPHGFCAFDGPGGGAGAGAGGDMSGFSRRTSTPSSAFLPPRFWPSGSLTSPHAGVVAAAAAQQAYPLSGPTCGSPLETPHAQPARRSSFVNLSAHRLGGAFSALGMTPAPASKSPDGGGGSVQTHGFSPFFPPLSNPSSAATTPASSPQVAPAELDTFRRTTRGGANDARSAGNAGTSAVAEDELPPLGARTTRLDALPASSAAGRRDSSRKRHMCFPDGNGGTFFVEQKERRRTASSSQV